VACCAASDLQALVLHKMGLNSIWDVPWEHATAAYSNGTGSKNGKGGLQTVQPSNGSSSSHCSSSGAALGGNGNTPHPTEAEAAAAAASGGGSKQGDQSSQAARAGQREAPVPAQEGSEFTTWKFRSNGVAKRTIDYVWYTGAQLVPVSRWRMLSEAEIGPSGLPNTVYPSDHMAVTCQFGWVDK
jgi:hypothetical protein